MKKALSLVLAALMLFAALGSLTACNDAEVAKVIDIALSEEEYAFAVVHQQPQLTWKVQRE